MKHIKQKFCRELGEEQVLFEEPMKRHTTFRIGGPAEVFVMPKTIEQIKTAVRICREEDLDWFVLGNGSNLLVSDQGYRGVIIQMDRNIGQVNCGRNRNSCGSRSTSFFYSIGSAEKLL